ncbi:MAG: AAA family ATPase, partial [Actinomycetota bacterium]|nr:AAA family ATPase [Actinomycetota bacterium]
VGQLLDVLLERAVAVEGGWPAAVDLALERPDLVVVTRAGDRFGAAGWRTGAAGSGATGAALDEARRHAEAVATEVAAVTERQRLARHDAATARAAETRVVKSLEENESVRAALTVSLARIEAELVDATAEAEAAACHVEELAARVERERARVAELEEVLPVLQAEEAADAEKLTAMQEARRQLEEQALGLAGARRDLDARRARLEDRRAYLSRRLVDVDERLQRNVAQREEAERHRTQLEQRAVAVDRLAALVEQRLSTVVGQVERLRAQRRRQSEETGAITDRLDHGRRERSSVERRLGELRERVQRSELEAAEARIRLEQAVETLRQQFDLEPEQAVKAECPELPTAVTAATRVRELERELRLMGPINPLALEEFAALQERHVFLEGQLEDVKATRRDLFKIIRAIDSEIVEVFAAAYADVAENFSVLFGMLFPGGSGRLKLTDPDNLLDTGVEVDARPSGKNVRQLSLLSGGERSLTALAFLFAVFRSRPSPFYLMDEVEAALDDVNLHRFLDLIDEFRREAQLVIVSHQKRTMEAADCLYGVTMHPGGSSRVLSEKVTAGA